MPARRAVLYVPAGLPLMLWLPRLASWAQGQGWEPSSYTSSWPELARLLGTGQRDLGVIATRGHLPLDRWPRVVAMDEQQPPGLPAAAERPTWRR